MWVEAELRQGLQSVRAPEELWERIQRRDAGVARGGRRYVWAIAAAAMAMLVLFLARPRGEFQSGDAARIRAWVRLHTGLDVPLQASTALQLVGAKGTEGKA